jgi:hypothetical protein
LHDGTYFTLQLPGEFGGFHPGLKHCLQLIVVGWCPSLAVLVALQPVAHSAVNAIWYLT